MKKTILIISLLCVLPAMSLDIPQLSYIIYKKQTHDHKNICTGEVLIKENLSVKFLINRITLDWNNHIRINEVSDTLYFIDSWGEFDFTPPSFLTVWNSRDTISYSIGEKDRVKKIRGVFNPMDLFYIDLISANDTTEFKRQEELATADSVMFCPRRFDIFATRVIIKNGKFDVQCYPFKEFVFLEKYL